MRPIDADAMIEDLVTVDPRYETMIDWAIRVTKAQPTIDAVPVVHGRWIIQDGKVVCSECFEPNLETYYCPYCGAKMDGEISEEEKNE